MAPLWHAQKCRAKPNCVDRLCQPPKPTWGELVRSRTSPRKLSKRVRRKSSPPPKPAAARVGGAAEVMLKGGARLEVSRRRMPELLGKLELG